MVAAFGMALFFTTAVASDGLDSSVMVGAVVALHILSVVLMIPVGERFLIEEWIILIE